MATILVVDDEPSCRTFLATLLRYHGHHILEAAEGREALELIQRTHTVSPINLLITDVLMPGMGGHELVQRLRADATLSTIPVIFFSAGYAEQHAHTLARACGVEHVLRKPSLPRDIMAVVNAVLQLDPSASLLAHDESFSHAHLRLITDRLAQEVTNLATVNSKLAVLLELSQQFALERDPRQLLDKFCQAARYLLGARQAAIGVLDDNGLSLRYFLTSGENLGETEAGLAPIWESLGRLVQEGGSLHGNLSASMLSAPIASPSRVYGWLCLSGKFDGSAFTGEDEHLAGILAGNLGRIYENDVLYVDLLRQAANLEQEIQERKRAEQALSQRSRQLETLRALDLAILQAQSPEEIARTALVHLHQLLQSPTSSVLVFDRPANEAILLASYPEGELKAGHRFALSNSGTLLESDFFTLQRMLPSHGAAQPLHIPLQARGETVGFLSVGVEANGRQPDMADIAGDVADAVAVAIQQAWLFEQVRSGREHLQRLSGQLLQAQECERRRIARELHDEIGQMLTALRLNLQALHRSKTSSSQPQLEESLAMVDRTLHQVRNLSLDLRPSMLDDLGLQAALRWYLDRLAKRAGLTAHFAAEPIDSPISPDVQTACFRVAQEALTNTLRHAQAQVVRVELSQQEPGLRMRITDDGIGFDVRAALQRASRGESLGLLGLQERVVLLGGRMDIASVLGRGTEISVTFPLTLQV